MPNGGISAAVHSSGSAFHWGIPTTMPGGQYRLCWCLTVPTNAAVSGAGVCSTPEDFFVDFGRLDVKGVRPTQVQDRTCVAGLSCAFDGLRGHLLHDADRVVILDTCGSATVLPRSPFAGLSTSVESTNAHYSNEHRRRDSTTDYVSSGQPLRRRGVWVDNRDYLTPPRGSTTDYRGA
jgi:hypothetical protein